MSQSEAWRNMANKNPHLRPHRPHLADVQLPVRFHKRRVFGRVGGGHPRRPFGEFCLWPDSFTLQAPRGRARTPPPARVRGRAVAAGAGLGAAVARATPGRQGRGVGLASCRTVTGRPRAGGRMPAMSSTVKGEDRPRAGRIIGRHHTPHQTATRRPMAGRVRGGRVVYRGTGRIARRRGKGGGRRAGRPGHSVLRVIHATDFLMPHPCRQCGEAGRSQSAGARSRRVWS